MRARRAVRPGGSNASADAAQDSWHARFASENATWRDVIHSRTITPQ